MAFIFRDDVLAPKGSVIIEYRGPNPIAAYHAMDGLLRKIFEAKGTHMFEPDFRWDLTEDPRPFLISMSMRRGLDKLTSMIIDVKLTGKQPIDPDRAGEISIEIGGRIETIYPTKTLLQKIFLPFIYVYHWVFYNRVRRRYLEYAKRGIARLEQELRALLKIPVGII